MFKQNWLFSFWVKRRQKIPADKQSSFLSNSWQKLKENRIAIMALWGLILLLIFSLIGPWLTPYSYSDIHLELKNKAPCSQFWFGSDELGRDVFTRIWWGARISLAIGILAALIDGVIGVIYGTLAAVSGRKIDELMMRFADVLSSVPYLLIVILLTVIRGTGMITILIAMTLTGWINMARIVRSQVLHLLSSDFILAAKGMGASRFHIMISHLLPNALASIIATMTLTIPSAIFTEAFLSFLGLGIQAPAASWGTMINDGISAMRYYPWRLFFPAFMISFTMLTFNLLGNGLRDALDPKLKR